MDAVFLCDTKSVYMSLLHAVSGKNLDYLDFAKWVETEYNLKFHYKALFVSNQTPEEAISFITYMRHFGFDVFVARRSWSVKLTLKCIDVLNTCNTFILATDDPDHLDVAKWLKERGKQVLIINFTPRKYFEKFCTTLVKVPIDILKDKKSGKKNDSNSATEHTQLSADSNSNVNNDPF